MIFESMEVRQLDINDLLILGRAGSLGRDRRCFRLGGSLYFGRTLGGLGSLGGFLCFLGGGRFPPPCPSYREPPSCRERRPRPPWAGVSGASGAVPASARLLGWSGRSRFVRGFRLLLGGSPLRGLLLGHDFREVKDRHAGGFLLLGSVSGFVLRGGASCAGASALSGAGASETDCSCLRACTPLASGWAGAGSEPGPAASVTIFAFSSAIHISAFLFDGMKKGPDFLRSNPACRDTSFLCP